MDELSKIIDKGFDAGGRVGPAGEQEQLANAVKEAIDLLDTGERRVAEKVDGKWKLHQDIFNSSQPAPGQ